MSHSRPHIYDYINYRKYLQDYLNDPNSDGKAWTHRKILDGIGVSSTGFLANVLNSKQHFTIDQAKAICELFKWEDTHSEYFKYMVYFEKAKTLDEKNDFYETLNKIRNRKLKKLSSKQLSLFTEWYYVVIRELINFFPFKDNYKELAKKINPSITDQNAQKAIRELEKMGFIKKGKEGYYYQTEGSISTGDELESFLVSKFQGKMIDLEKRALDKVPAEDRDISGLTLTISRDKFERIKKEIQSFRKKIIQLIETDEKPDSVYRLSFKLFPLTKREKRKK